MKNGLQKQSSCPRIPPRNRNSEYCVASFISRESCVNGGGNWTKVLTNYKERLSNNADLCASVKRVYGVPYEAHKITQGSDNQEQVLVRADETEVVYAPSTVVNHNGLNMEGKFSSYKWKVPHFPSQTIQRCVLRIRWDVDRLSFFAITKQFLACLLAESHGEWEYGPGNYSSLSSWLAVDTPYK